MNLSIINSLTMIYYKYFITQRKNIENRFQKRLGRKVELNNPIKYNDKLQWLKLNWNDSTAIDCADKYKVRKIVSDRIGEEYLNELHAVYESIEDINFNELPNSFVLKGTHGSGLNIICKNKSDLNQREAMKKMRKWFNYNHYWRTGEWVYKEIKPRIICEKYIEQENGNELRDYRFFCFNGEPKLISVDFNINDKSKTRRNLYDLDWNMIEAQISYPNETNLKIEKPIKLEKMIELSKALSAGFPHARIDFYYINNKIIFGEITFFHQSGMGKILPEEFEKELGCWIKLN